MGRSKFDKREFRLGDFWLGRRGDSPAFYRCWLEGSRTRRVSLGTADYEEARQRFQDWFVANIRLDADHAAPEKLLLTAALDDYWYGHANKLASAKSRFILLRYWREFWGDATVAEVRSIPRQERFQQHLFAKGLNVGSVNRTLEVGAAAINRAWKRGIISSAPFVLKVPDTRDRADTKKGRVLTLAELRAFYRGSNERHWHDLLHLLIGTACRPEAARELTKAQIDFENGLIRLNGPGRRQTVKFRPEIRLPEGLKLRFEDRPDGRLVLWRGEPMKKNECLMRRARNRAGLDRTVNLYSIRHTCAKWMRSHGVDPWTVACQLGHSAGGKLKMTEVYASADPAYLAAACQALSKLLEAVIAPEAHQTLPQTTEIAA